VADSLQILSNVGGTGNGGYGGGTNYGGGYGTVRRVSFPATVLNRDGSRRLSVRGDNGRNYTVESRSTISRVDDGDRVRVEGTSRDGVVTDAHVVLLRNSDSPIYNGQDINFAGRVQRVDTRNDLIVVREDATGRTYSFASRKPQSFQVGQRVRAYATVQNGRAVVTRVVRL